MACGSGGIYCFYCHVEESFLMIFYKTNVLNFQLSSSMKLLWNTTFAFYLLLNMCKSRDYYHLSSFQLFLGLFSLMLVAIYRPKGL